MAGRDKVGSLKEYIDEALENIRNDREVTTSLLRDAMLYLSGAEDRHEKIGQVVAKYVETLQRSNEQLVKLASLAQKRESTSAEMTSVDREEIFDLIQNNKETA